MPGGAASASAGVGLSSTCSLVAAQACGRQVQGECVDDETTRGRQSKDHVVRTGFRVNGHDDGTRAVRGVGDDLGGSPEQFTVVLASGQKSSVAIGVSAERFGLERGRKALEELGVALVVVAHANRVDGCEFGTDAERVDLDKAGPRVQGQFCSEVAPEIRCGARLSGESDGLQFLKVEQDVI